MFLVKAFCGLVNNEHTKDIIDQIDIKISGQESMEYIGDWSVASTKSSKSSSKYSHSRLLRR